MFEKRLKGYRAMGYDLSAVPTPERPFPRVEPLNLPDGNSGSKWT